MGALEFTPEALAAACHDIIPDNWQPRAEGERIAARHGLSYGEMVGPSRSRPCPQARAEFYRLLRDHGWSLPKIAAFVGGRDHTTIMNALADGERRAKKLKARRDAYHARKVA